MSLDLMIDADQCPHCNRADSTESFNYTYNASMMWHKICPTDDRMVQIEGMTGQQVAKKIRAAIAEMESRPTELKKLEPENGWGSYVGFLQFLYKILDASERNPDSIWRADR